MRTTLRINNYLTILYNCQGQGHYTLITRFKGGKEGGVPPNVTFARPGGS